MSGPQPGNRYELRSAFSSNDHFAVEPADLADAEREAGELVGYVHSYEAGSAVDGPGLRMVAFLTGCLLRCRYCHNPDTWHRLAGTRISLTQMKQEIDQYANMLRLSRGGVTLSGGEPLVQHEFATAVFRYCKEIGVHTALDTSGRLGERLSDEQLLDIDLTLLDIKSGIPATYEAVTGGPLDPTLAFARRLSSLGRRMWIRFVLVPGLTDAPENVEAVARFAASLTGVERVEVLRFHQLGRRKWHDLNLAYALDDVQPPDETVVKSVKERFRRHGLTVY